MYKPSMYSIWVARFFSLSIAILLWYYVYDLDRNTETRIVDIEFRNPPADYYTEFDYSKQKVSVTVSGKKDAVNEVLPSLHQLKYYVDLKEAVPGEKRYKIIQDKNNKLEALLKKYEIVPDIDPDRITIEYDKIINKEVPIVVDLKVELQKDYKIVKQTFKPNKVTLRGPEKILKEIKEIKTKALVVQKRNHDYRGYVKLDLKDIPDTVYIPEVRRVKVELDIGRDIVEKKLKAVPITVLPGMQNGLTHVEKDLKLDYIIIKGLNSDMQNINLDDFRGYITISKINKPGQYLFKVQVNTPEKIIIKDYSPKKMKLTIKDLD